MRRLALAILAVLALSLSGAEHASVQSVTRSGDWVLEQADLAAGEFHPYQETGESFLLHDLGDGTPERLTYEGFAEYVSPVRRTEFRFNGVGARWAARLPDSSYMFMELRVSDDGATWSEWLPAPELDQFSGQGSQSTDLLLTQGSYLQFRLKLLADGSDQVPAVQWVRLTYIDSTDGPAAPAPGAYQTTATAPPLSVLGRSTWGANEAYRYSNRAVVWPPQYAAPKKMIIHHSATTTNPPDAAAVVRAIYYYHAVTLGWGDIGYNYLVDGHGRVYEGRYGGATPVQHVIGGHALEYNPGSIGICVIGNFAADAPPAPMVDAVAALVARYAQKYGIEVQGSGYFVHKVMPNVSGHRDCYSTACPGDKMFNLLPSIRERAAKIVASTGGMPPAAATCTAQAPAAGAPGLLNPANCGALSGFQAALKWTNPAGATQYEVRLLPFNADGPAMDLIRNVEGPAGSFTISAPPAWYLLLPDMTYAWAVRTTSVPTSVGSDDAGWGPWSPTWAFHTPKVSSTTITPAGPAVGAVAESRMPTLQWADTNQATWYYEVQVSTDKTFTTDPAKATAAVYWNLVHGGATNPPKSWTVPVDAALTKATTYFWRVRPRVQGDGQPAAWSSTWSFKTPITDPAPTAGEQAGASKAPYLTGTLVERSGAE